MPSRKLIFAQGDKETDTHTHMNWCAHLLYKDLNTQLHFAHRNKTTATIHIFCCPKGHRGDPFGYYTYTNIYNSLPEISCLHVSLILPLSLRLYFLRSTDLLHILSFCLFLTNLTFLTSNIRRCVAPLFVRTWLQ